MGVVSASGSSNALLNYSFKDVSPISGTNYYQLNMVDKDGTSKKSTVVCANFDIEKADFNVSTNATKGTISLSVYSSRSKQAGFEVFDLQSRTLLKENLRLNEGINIFKFKLSVAPNMIIVRLNTEGDVQTKKLYF